MSRTDFFRKMLSDTETTARITTRADVLRELFQEFDAEIAALKARVEELEAKLTGVAKWVRYPGSER